jgi:large conductance mechanosensitive channel
MVSDFFQFLSKTNALALAVGVILGTAIGKVVASIVGDVLMPIVGLAVGGGDWRSWLIPLKTAPDGKILSGIGIGSFLGTVVDFVIIAFCVFLITRSLLKEPPPPPGPPMKTCPACGESILAKATRCKFCTSPV